MTTTEIERMVVRLVGDGASYQRMAQQAQAQTKALGRQLEGETKKAEVFGKTIDNLGTGMSNFAGQMRAMAALGSPMEQLKRGVSLAAEAESMQVSFGVMLGSARKAEEMLRTLQKFAAETPFTMTGLTQATRTLLQFGITGEQVVPILKSMGDVSGGESEKLQRLSLAFGQMSATGRLMGEELNQMIEAGFNPLKEISRTSGKSMAVLRAEMEQGKISTDLVTAAFRSASSEGGPFFNLMEKQSKTLKGLWSTMTDDIDAAQRSVGKAVIEMFSLKEAVQAVSNAAQGFDRRFNEMDRDIKSVIVAVVTAVGVLSGFWLTWKIGAIAIGMVVGVAKDLVVTLKWVTAGLWAAVKAAFAWATTTNLLTAAVAALKAALVVGAVLGLVAAFAALVNEVTGVNREMKTLNKEMDQLTQTRGRMMAEGFRRTERMVEGFGVEEPTVRKDRLEAELKANQKNLDTLQRDYDKAKELVDGFGLAMKFSGFLPATTDVDLLSDRAKGKLKEFSGQLDVARDRSDKLKAALQQMSPEALNDAAKKDLNDFIKAQEKSLLAVGKTDDEIKVLELRQKLYAGAVAASNAGEHDKATKLYQSADAAVRQAQTLVDLKNRQAEYHKGVEEARKATEKATDDVYDFVDSMRSEMATFGMTAGEAKLYEFAMKVVDETHLSAARDVLAAKEAFDRMREAVEFGKKVAEEYATANDKYQDRVTKLSEALAHGAISEALFNAAMRDAGKQLQDAEDQANSARQAVEKFDAALAGSAEAKFRVSQYREQAKSLIPRAVRSYATAEGFPLPETGPGDFNAPTPRRYVAAEGFVDTDAINKADADKQSGLLTSIRDLLREMAYKQIEEVVMLPATLEE